MVVKHYSPSRRLKPFVKNFMIIKSKDGMENRILPGTSIVMAFRIKGEVFSQENEKKDRMSGLAIAGLRKTPRVIRYSKQSATLLVFFKEGKVGPFFDFSLHELFGLHTSLDCQITRSFLDRIEEQLWQAENDSQRIAIVEQFLIQQIRNSKRDRLVHQAIKEIRYVKGDLKIGKLLTNFPISRNPFEKRFRRAIGTSPKHFANIVRLKHVINSYSPKKSMTEIALAAGYFDQSHFIKDFKSFTGQTPTVFFASTST